MARRWLAVAAGAAAVAALAALLVVGRQRPVRILYVRDNVLAVGQVGQVLEKTDILRRRGVTAVVRGVRLADLRADQMHATDVVLNGQGAPLRMIGDGYQGRVVGTLGSGGRLALMVAPGSPIEKISDLRHRTVLGMRMNALHTALVAWLTDAGVAPRSVAVTDYDKHALTAADVAARDDVAAVVAWDPLLEELATAHGYRALAWGDYHTTIVVSRRLLEEEPELGRRTLLALLDAALFLREQTGRANAWFRAAHPVDAALLDRIMQRNHIVAKTSALSLNADRSDFASAMAASVDFLEQRGRIPAGLTYLDAAPMRGAEAIWVPPSSNIPETK